MVTLTKFSSLVTLDVVIVTTPGVTSVENFVKMTTLCFNGRSSTTSSVLRRFQLAGFVVVVVVHADEVGRGHRNG